MTGFAAGYDNELQPWRSASIGDVAGAPVTVRPGAPGYLLDLAPEDVDVTVFARFAFAGQGRDALAAGDAAADRS